MWLKKDFGLKLIFLTLVVIGNSTVLKAQFRYYQNYTSADGLNNGSCYALHQDQRGFVWVATNTGLDRFDGSTFKNFDEDDGFDGTLLRRIREDSLGRIWVMTYFGGLFHSQDSTGTSFTEYEHNEKVKSLGAGPWDFFFDKEKGLTIDFSSRRLSGIEGEAEGVGFLEAGAIFHVPSHERSFCNNNRFIDKVICITERDSQVFVVPRMEQPGYFPFYLDANAFLYGAYLVEVTEGGCVLNTLPEKATCLESISAEEYLLGTSSGLWRFNRALQTSQLLIPNINVSDILIGSQGNVWVATRSNGIYKIPSLEIMTYEVVEEDEAGLIGFGTGVEQELCVYSKHVLYAKEVDSTSFERSFHVTEADVAIRDVLGQAETTEKILVCNFGQPNVRVIDGVEYRKKEQFPLSHQVHHGRFRNGDLYLTTARGVYQYDIDKNEAMALQPDTSVILCHSLEMDEKGLFWCGGMGEVYRETAKGLTSVIDLETLIIGLDFCEGHLVVATQKKGIRLLDTASMELTTIREEDGLSDDLMSNVMVYKDQIWVSSKKGINLIERKGEQWKVSTPFISTVLNHRIVMDMMIRDSLLWVCLPRSVVSIPLKVGFPENMWPVLITGAGTERQAIPKLESSFAHNENDVSLHFSEPNFLNLFGDKYLYRLLGSSNEEWKGISDESITFPSLQPGAYEFQIKAKPFSDDVAVPEASNYSFSVLHPFWKTWWFIGLEVLFLLFLIYVLIQYRSTQLANKEVLKTELVRLELKALKAQINPHFVYNAISSVQYYLSKNESSEAQKYMRDFAHLIRKVLEHSDKSLIPLQSELRLIENYVDLEARKLDGETLIFKQEIADQINPLNVRIPPALFQPFVENAIFHGLKNKQGERKLVVRVHRTSKELYVEIEDNGIGRKRSAEGQRSAYRGPSFGISIASERIRVLNGAEDRESVVIKDLTGHSGEALGTRVTLSIPYISVA